MDPDRRTLQRTARRDSKSALTYVKCELTSPFGLRTRSGRRPGWSIPTRCHTKRPPARAADPCAKNRESASLTGCVIFGTIVCDRPFQEATGILLRNAERQPARQGLDQRTLV